MLVQFCCLVSSYPLLKPIQIICKQCREILLVHIEHAQTEGVFPQIGGIFSGLTGLKYRGYEIHMGQSGDSSAVLRNGNVYGSYIHGIFDENGIAETIARALYKERGLEFSEDNTFDIHAYKETQYDKLAETVREALDMDLIYRILEEGV